MKIFNSLIYLTAGSLSKVAWLALTTSIVTTLAYDNQCQRWNCPCSGYPRRMARSISLGGDSMDMLRRKTYNAKQNVMDLLQKIVSSKEMYTKIKANAGREKNENHSICLKL
jgi:hypothetical protein